MEVEPHVRGLPATLRVIADVDACQLAEYIALEALVRRVALQHFDPSFRVDHETDEDLSGHIRSIQQWIRDVVPKCAIQVPFQIGALCIRGNTEWFCGPCIAEGEYRSEQKQCAGDGGFHGRVVLVLFVHRTVILQGQLQGSGGIVMNGEEGGMSGDAATACTENA